MSAVVKQPVHDGVNQASNKQAIASQGSQNYRGFVAGVFSGIAKLSGMYFFHGQCLGSRLISHSRPPVRILICLDFISVPNTTKL